MAKGTQNGAGGVCFYFKEKYKFKITKIRRKTNHNILWVKIKGEDKKKDTFLGLVYCRTDSHFDEVNSFYATLAHDVLQYSSVGEILLLGDFNSRLGSVTGDTTPDGKWATNKNCPLFQSFLAATDLELLNCKLAFGKPTFVRPSQNATSIIDFVLATPRLAAKISKFNVEVLDTGSYVAHNTSITLAHPISFPIPTQNSNPSHFYQQLTNKNQAQFFSEVMKYINPHFPNPESGFENLIGALESARMSTLRKPCKSRDGSPQQIPRLTELRRQLNRWANKLIHMRTLPANNPQVDFAKQCYRRISAELHRVESAMRAEAWELQLAKLDQLDFVNRTKHFWRLIARLRRNNSSSVSFSIKNIAGIESTSREEFCSNWMQFYERLYSPNPTPSLLRKRLSRINIARAKNIEVSGILDIPITRAEFDLALKSQRNNSAPGFDSVVPQMLSMGPENFKTHVFRLLKQTFASESNLKCLKKILIAPIIKDHEGDVHDPGNFRPIALLSNIFKLYESILNRRLIDFLEDLRKDSSEEPQPRLSELQMGFRPGRSCVDNLYILRELILDYKFKQNNKPIYLAFLDLRKAFDRVCREILWDRLFQKGVHGRFWRIIRKLYSDFKGRAKFKGNIITNPFRIDTGVVQGSRLGPTLFNVFFDDFICKLQNKFQGARFSFGKKLSTLAYADDIVLLSSNPKEMQKMLDFCSKYAQENEFEFNIGKCKILKVHCKGAAKQVQFNMGGQALKEVDSYRYLGVPFGRAMHPNSRPSAFGKYFSKIEKKARSRLLVSRFLGAKKDGLRPKTGLRLYKMLVRPILEYACPVVCFTNTQIEKLEKLQNFAIKTACGLRHNTKTASVRVISGIEPIQTRFAYLKLKHLYRILQKPKQSPVSEIFRGIQAQSHRPGFLAECQNICDSFGINFQRAAPTVVEESLKEFGARLKADLYHRSFQLDLKAIRNSNQASVLASLFPPDASYFSYRPLDLIERILHRENRAVRTGFLQNLCGSSFLANCIQKRCCFCKERIQNIAHYIFDCAKISKERNLFLESTTTYLNKTNQHLAALWADSMQNVTEPTSRSTMCAVLFGGNFALNREGDWILFRKAKYQHSHQSDKTCIKTGEFLAMLQQSAEEQEEQ